MVEGVEEIGEFAGIESEEVRPEFLDGLFDDGREPGEVPGKRDLMLGLVVVSLLELPCFFEDAAGPGVGVLDVGPALPLEVERLLPVKDRALLGRDLHDVVADGGDGDRLCDRAPFLFGEFRPADGHLLERLRGNLLDQRICRDELPCPGAHRALGEGDELEEDDLGRLLAEEFEGGLELGADQLVVRAEDVDHPVVVARLPGVVGEITGAVDRCAVAPPEDILLLEATLREVDPECLVLVRLRQTPDLLDDPVDIADPDEIALPDEPIVVGVQSGKGLLDPLGAEGDGSPKLCDGLGITAFHHLHETVDLFGGPGVLLDLPVCRDVDPGDVVVGLFTLLPGDTEVVKSPGDDGDLAAHIV